MTNKIMNCPGVSLKLEPVTLKEFRAELHNQIDGGLTAYPGYLVSTFEVNYNSGLGFQRAAIDMIDRINRAYQIIYL